MAYRSGHYRRGYIRHTKNGPVYVRPTYVNGHSYDQSWNGVINTGTHYNDKEAINNTVTETTSSTYKNGGSSTKIEENHINVHEKNYRTPNLSSTDNSNNEAEYPQTPITMIGSYPAYKVAIVFFSIIAVLGIIVFGMLGDNGWSFAICNITFAGTSYLGHKMNQAKSREENHSYAMFLGLLLFIGIVIAKMID